MDVASVDLNLLVALEALLTERHVTRAGRRLGLTQSAMSSALGRLRTLFGDPLFEREAGAMRPTPRALALEGDVSAALALVRRVVAGPPGWDPAHARRSFVLAVDPNASLVVAPALLQRLSALAPQTSVRVLSLHSHQPPEGLARGEVDLAIGVFRDVAPGHHQRLLYRDSVVACVRAGHPHARELSTPEGYAAMPHVLISPRGHLRGAIDVALEAQSLSRHVVATVPTLLDAVAVVLRSDAVLTVGRIAAASLPFDRALHVVDVPVELPPIEHRTLWHERYHDEASLVWLVDVVHGLRLEVSRQRTATTPRRTGKRRSNRYAAGDAVAQR